MLILTHECNLYSVVFEVIFIAPTSVNLLGTFLIKMNNLDRSKLTKSAVDKQDNWTNENSAKRSRRSGLSQHSSWINPDGSFLRNPYGQAGFFQRSMSICFVCGNPACEDNMIHLYSRSSRSQTDAPFFPFLEYHDPAPGADPMRDDRSVDACFVCNALLTQQWESFERSRTPIGKRLYWLKRPSGCEIRQAVSQIELEEILNEHSRETYDDKENSESEEESRESQQIRKSSPSCSPETSENPHLKEEDASALGTISSESRSSNVIKSSFICFSCGRSGALQSTICRVYCKPSYEQMRAGIPFYPSILSQEGAPGSQVLYNSITYLCMTCLPKYQPEWHRAQEDFMKQGLTKSVLPRIPLPELVLCYLCGSDISTKYNNGLLHKHTRSAKANPQFLALKKYEPIQGAVPLSFGFTYLCAKCLETHNDNVEKEVEH